MITFTFWLAWCCFWYKQLKATLLVTRHTNQTASLIKMMNITQPLALFMLQKILFLLIQENSGIYYCIADKTTLWSVLPMSERSKEPTMLSITMVNVCGGFLGFIFIVCNLTLASYRLPTELSFEQLYKLDIKNSVSSSFIVTKLPSSYHRNQTTTQVLSSVLSISNINSQAHFSLFCGQSGG